MGCFSQEHGDKESKYPYYIEETEQAAVHVSLYTCVHVNTLHGYKSVQSICKYNRLENTGIQQTLQ